MMPQQTTQALEIRQTSKFEGDDWWTWSIWLEGPDAELDRVARVTYRLHPTFPKPVRIVTDRSTKFRLSEQGWGVFRIYAEVIYRDGSGSTRLQHDLQLQYPEATEVTVGTESKESNALSSEAVPEESRDSFVPEPLPVVEATRDLPLIRLFISHRAKDRKAVERLRRELLAVANGRLAVITSSDIAGGDGWNERARRALDEVNYLALLYTDPVADEPDWPMFEWGYFAGHTASARLPLYVVLCAPGVAAPKFLGDRQTYKATPSEIGALLTQFFTLPLKEGAPPIVSGPLDKRTLEPVISAVLEAAGEPPVSMDYTLRLRVSVAASDVSELEQGRVPPTSLVSGDPNALEILGACADGDRFSWQELLHRAKAAPGDERPTFLWAEYLGMTVARALASRRFRPALPTLFSPHTFKAYLPSLSRLSSNRDGSLIFEVSFTELPPELNAWPEGHLGALAHVLALSRMFYWGVIIPFTTRFREMARREVSAGDVDTLYRELEAAIHTIVIDARNRGMVREKYLDALPSKGDIVSVRDQLSSWDKASDSLQELIHRDHKSPRDALPILNTMRETAEALMQIFAAVFLDLLRNEFNRRHNATST